jgi:hypothetical protein
MAGIERLNETASRGTRMLRTALGPAIAIFLQDSSVVEVRLNPVNAGRNPHFFGGIWIGVNSRLKLA